MPDMPRETARAAGAAGAEAAARAAFVVRPILASEYETLGELLVAAYRGIAAMPQSEAYNEELRAVARRARESCVLVAVDECGVVLGGVTFVSGLEDPYSEQLREGEAGMRMLAVTPAARRRGVGRALTLECLRRARAAGKRRLVLHTGTWMPEARRLYESIGFRRDPAVDFTPVPGVDLLAYAFEFEE